MNLPPLIFLIGLAGAGKTYVGGVIAEAHGYHFHDLDQDFTPEIQQAIAEKRPFTDEIRDKYFAVICQRIEVLRAQHPRLILAQAAYKERHRTMVKAAHPDIEFVWVEAPEGLILQRLAARGDTISPEYARLLALSFERPINMRTLVNDGDGKTILRQLQGMSRERAIE